MASFLGEVKRRKVFQIAAVYIVVAWLIMQVVDVIDEPLRVPEWFATVVLLLLALGFPVALVLSWAFEVTPDGVVRDEGGTARPGGRAVEYVLIGVLSCAVLWLLYRDMSAGTGLSSTAAIPAPAAVPSEADIELRQNGIAILPFENMSVDPDDAFFAAGIHDEIIHQVANIEDLDVLARTSVMQYEGARRPITEIARELNVANVLEGSVSYAGERVRIRAQLIDGRSGGHLWSEVYQGDITDVFGFYADISESIAEALETELLPDQRARIGAVLTESPAAYALYLAALEEPTERAIELLDRALEADDEFARAHAMKAQLLGFGFVGEVTRAEADSSRDASTVAAELERTVIAHANRALDLDPASGLAHAALGAVHLRYWRREAAATAFARAYELSPKDPEVLRWYSLYSSWTGDHERAIELAETAAVLEPDIGTVAFLFGNQGSPYFWSGDYATAAREYEDAVAARPEEVFLYFHLAEVEAARGDLATAVQYLRILEQVGERFGQGGLARMAYVYSLAGLAEEAQQLVRETEERATPPSTVQRAVNQLALGNTDEALQLFEEAADFRLPSAGATLTIMIKNNVYNDPVLERPEFVDVRRRLGFAE